MKNLDFANIRLQDGFWKGYEDLNRKVTVWAVYDQFRETGRFEALKCKWRKGDPKEPHIYWDSDVAKWMEGAACLIEKEPDPELEALLDGMIADIAANQREDGYFNSHFLTVEPEKAFTVRDWHELYCAGHLIEAAIAYHKATGKRLFLDCMLKYADYIARVFMEEESAGFVTPGHPEIELALLKLYDHLGMEKHLKLARFFIDNRGNAEKIENRGETLNDHMLLKDLSEASGHAVRAGYLYTAMAMLAKADQDEALKAACMRLYADIVGRKMSITGGVGSEPHLEQFSYAYDLPNRESYNETCAAIALAMFSGAMQELEPDSRCGDVIERIYYNGFLSGISLSGDRFFYSNALELDQKKYRRHAFQSISERPEMFGCACCPPNMVRMLATLPRYAYSQEGNRIFCHQFMNSHTTLEIGGKPAELRLSTNYPQDGKLVFTYHGEPAELYVRIPEWCVEYDGVTENGFARFALTDGVVVTVDLPMVLHFVQANPNVQDDSGRYAVTRGPIVYCLEGLDNGENLRDVRLCENGAVRIAVEEGVPAPVLYLDAMRRRPGKALYYLKNEDYDTFTARLIPYFCFANRGATDLQVWVMVQ